MSADMKLAVLGRGMHVAEVVCSTKSTKGTQWHKGRAWRN